MAEEDVWMSTALLAKDNKFAFQPASFFSTLSKTKLKSWLDPPRCLIGKPRYPPKQFVDWNPRIMLKASLLSWSIFGEKKALDLAPLIVWPETLQNMSSTFLMTSQFLGVALAKRTKLSAKKKRERRSTSRGFHWFPQPRFTFLLDQLA